MARGTILSLAVGAVFVVGSVSQAVMLEFPLGGQGEYERIIGPLHYEEHSSVDVYVENDFNPLRWKEWRIEIWVPQGSPQMTEMQVDYDNTLLHNSPIEVFPVPLNPAMVPAPWPNYVGYYADTWEADWDQYGTTPENGGGDHPWGNPRWVSFHFYIDDTCQGWGLYIKDSCVPEPATVMLLGVGALALLRRRIP